MPVSRVRRGQTSPNQDPALSLSTLGTCNGHILKALFHLRTGLRRDKAGWEGEVRGVPGLDSVMAGQVWAPSHTGMHPIIRPPLPQSSRKTRLETADISAEPSQQTTDLEPSFKRRAL
ncbi:hypothetical protein AAFF_G00338380 [Aldrovandia affinis]|uniref:Uncharacterized protein n=1 Tax=Aldrovandia affinis TaxID=143900 RepID=A0AAD7R6Q3_9TELE|nr:hypothetical protein AAFF_G00338380 [Aldrovandia affinis]